MVLSRARVEGVFESLLDVVVADWAAQVLVGEFEALEEVVSELLRLESPFLDGVHGLGVADEEEVAEVVAVVKLGGVVAENEGEGCDGEPVEALCGLQLAVD